MLTVGSVAPKSHSAPNDTPTFDLRSRAEEGRGRHRHVFLNGEVMRLADPVRGVLPAIKGRPVAAGEAVHFPPVSYGFVVFPEAGMALCK
jgi:hypothetical protein